MFDDGAAVQIGQRITLRGLPFRLAAGNRMPAAGGISGLPGASKAEAAERDKMNVEDI